MFEQVFRDIDDSVKEFGSIAVIREMFAGFQQYLHEYRGGRMTGNHPSLNL